MVTVIIWQLGLCTDPRYSHQKVIFDIFRPLDETEFTDFVFLDSTSYMGIVLLWEIESIIYIGIEKVSYRTI